MKKTLKSTKCYILFDNFPESSAKNFNVVSHLQVSQIQKIKSKKGTGTWNPNRMITFQGQSAKRHSSKKNFKSGQNQRNAIFIFITFRNHRQKDFNVVSHLQVSQIPKIKSKIGHRNLESQQNDNISRSVGETSLKQEKLQKRSKSTKCYIHFHNFPESSAKKFNVVLHLQVSQIPKIKSKKAPELGIPAE